MYSSSPERPEAQQVPARERRSAGGRVGVEEAVVLGRKRIQGDLVRLHLVHRGLALAQWLPELGGDDDRVLLAVGEMQEHRGAGLVPGDLGVRELQGRRHDHVLDEHHRRGIVALRLVRLGPAAILQDRVVPEGHHGLQRVAPQVADEPLVHVLLHPRPVDQAREGEGSAAALPLAAHRFHRRQPLLLVVHELEEDLRPEVADEVVHAQALGGQSPGVRNVHCLSWSWCAATLTDRRPGGLVQRCPRGALERKCPCSAPRSWSGCCLCS